MRSLDGNRVMRKNHMYTIMHAHEQFVFAHIHDQKIYKNIASVKGVSEETFGNVGGRKLRKTPKIHINPKRMPRITRPAST